MNQLGDLLRGRRDELRKRGVTVEHIADRADLAPSVVYYHLKQTDPFRQTPRQETLRKLAAGFQIPVTRVREAAREATGPVKGNPLQLLVANARAESGMTFPQAAQKAADAGLSLSTGTLSNITNGQNVNPGAETLKALAVVFDVPLADLKAAAKQARGQFTYRLPSHLEDEMTPEKWRKIIRLVESALDLDE